MHPLAPVAALLPGCQVRAVTMDDVPALTALMGRVSVAAIGYPDTSEDEVRDELVGPRFDLSRDTAVALDDSGRALVYCQAYDEHDERAFLDVFVDPGLDDELFRSVAKLAVGWSIERLREALAERSATQTVIGAGLYRGEERMLAVYRAAGFEHGTSYWRMQIDLPPDHVAGIQVPDGVQISRVDPQDDSVMATALRLRNDTFSGHHGHVDMTFDDYAEVWRNSTKYDPTAWWFAYSEGEPVGLCLGDESRIEEAGGYVRTLGVTQATRGRGIARALLMTAFAEYARRGRSCVQLGVDTGNGSGAVRLYESVGMRPVVTIDSLELAVSVS